MFSDGTPLAVTNAIVLFVFAFAVNNADTDVMSTRVADPLTHFDTLAV
jgi:hypothetical protein